MLSFLSVADISFHSCSPCWVAGFLDLTTVSVTLERIFGKAPCCEEHQVSFCFYGNLIEESWKELSVCLSVYLLGGEGQRSSCVPLTIWKNSNQTFIPPDCLSVWLCFHLLDRNESVGKSCGEREDCGWDCICIQHQNAFFSDYRSLWWVTTLWHLKLSFCKQPNHLSTLHL